MTGNTVVLKIHCQYNIYFNCHYSSYLPKLLFYFKSPFLPPLHVYTTNPRSSLSSTSDLGLKTCIISGCIFVFSYKSVKSGISNLSPLDFTFFIAHPICVLSSDLGTSSTNVTPSPSLLFKNVLCTLKCIPLFCVDCHFLLYDK